MPELNETKCNKNWIFRNLEKFNEMQKVMLGNAKKLKNSENILCYQETVIFIMK